MKWEEFKVQAYAAPLMEEKKSRRKEARLASSNEEAIASREFLLNYIQSSRPPPSKERMEAAQRLKDELREEVRNLNRRDLTPPIRDSRRKSSARKNSIGSSERDTLI